MAFHSQLVENAKLALVQGTHGVGGMSGVLIQKRYCVVLL